MIKKLEKIVSIFLQARREPQSIGISILIGIQDEEEVVKTFPSSVVSLVGEGFPLAAELGFIE